MVMIEQNKDSLIFQKCFIYRDEIDYNVVKIVINFVYELCYSFKTTGIDKILWLYVDEKLQ